MANDRTPADGDILPLDQGRYPGRPIQVNPMTGDSPVRIWWTQKLALAERSRLRAYDELLHAQAGVARALIERDMVVDELNDIETALQRERKRRRAEMRLQEVAELNAETELELARQRLAKVKRGEDYRQEEIDRERMQVRQQKMDAERDLAKAETQIKRDQLASDVELAELTARLKKLKGEDGAQKIHSDARKFQTELQRQEDMLATLKQKIDELINARGGVEHLSVADQDKIRQWEDLAQTLLRL